MANGLPAVQSLTANTNYNAGTSNPMAMQSGAGQSNGNLFNLQSAHDYSNDIVAQNLNTGCTGLSQTNPSGSIFPQNGYCTQPQVPEQAAYQQQTQNPEQAAPAFSGNPYSQQELAQYYNVLNKTQEQNEPKASSTGKKLGVVLGALIPFAKGLYKVANGESWGNAFKVKSLALKVPLLAIAGWVAGALFDGLTKPKPEAQAQTQAQAQSQIPAQYQQQEQQVQAA